MRFKNPIDRRTFLAGAGASLLLNLPEASYANLMNADLVFASAVRYKSRTFGIILFNEFGKKILELPLPNRGHSVVFNPTKDQGIAFSRRPGTFALVFSLSNQHSPFQISAPPARHYYGHGAFSQDGKLLYASENDFENARGAIGIYDSTNQFNRIGEFSSYGIGPHEIRMHPSKDILIVANGGIETHPEFGRAKLNLPTMEPSLVFLDLSTGDLVEKHKLSASNKLSIRHLDVSKNGEVVFGCQYEGPETDRPSLLGSCVIGEEIGLWGSDNQRFELPSNYVGSVCLNDDGDTVMATLPKGDSIALFSAKQRKLKTILPSDSAFGVSQNKRGFVTTSESGIFRALSERKSWAFQGVQFDNHISRIEAV
ncbi:MAG: DUF1513 domain-containing protein [Pseudomonadota bacterium]